MAKSENITSRVSRLVETIVVDRDAPKRSRRRKQEAIASLVRWSRDPVTGELIVRRGKDALS